MKRLAVLFAVLILLAGTHAYAENIKIGSVDLFKALNESDAGKKAKADLESMVKSKTSSLEEKGKTIEKLKNELEKQSSALSADARKSKEEDLERQIRDYQRQLSDSQNEVKKKEGELRGSILKEMADIIDKIGAEQGYTIIVDGGEGPVLFAKKDIDLTDAVIKRHNELKAKPKK